MSRAYEAFSPEIEFQERCDRIKRRMPEISNAAVSLVREALELTNHHVLEGSCKYVKVR